MVILLRYDTETELYPPDVFNVDDPVIIDIAYQASVTAQWRQIALRHTALQDASCRQYKGKSHVRVTVSEVREAAVLLLIARTFEPRIRKRAQIVASENPVVVIIGI